MQQENMEVPLGFSDLIFHDFDVTFVTHFGRLFNIKSQSPLFVRKVWFSTLSTVFLFDAKAWCLQIILACLAKIFLRGKELGDDSGSNSSDFQVPREYVF